MSVYTELFEARFNEVRHDFRHANEGRGYARPSSLRSFLRRFASR